MKKVTTICLVMVFMLAVSGTAMAELVSHWPFDEGSGDIAYDSIGTNDGTVYGATWTTGVMGGALEFDGDNDYVDLDTTGLFDGWTAATIAFWAAPVAVSETWPCVFAKWTGYSYYEAPAVGIHTPTGMWFWEVTKDPGTSGTNVYRESTVAVDYGVWQHIAYVFDFTSSEVRLYKDGELAQTWSVDIGDCMASGTNTVIGGVVRAYARHFFKGTLDEMAIWDHALNENEVLNAYIHGALATNVVTLRFNANNIFNYATSDDTRLNQQGTARRLWDCPTGREYMTYNDGPREDDATPEQDLQSVAQILGWEAFAGYQGASHLQLWLSGGKGANWGERIVMKAGTTLTVSTGGEFDWTVNITDNPWVAGCQIVHFNTVLGGEGHQNAISPDFNPAENLWSVTGDFYVDENGNSSYDEGVDSDLLIGNKYAIWFDAPLNNWRCRDAYGNDLWEYPFPNIQGTIMATAVVGVADILVDIDIKPGSEDGDDNTISMETQALIPVAIFSEVDEEGAFVFDATTVDADTLELAGAEAGVRMQGKGNEFMAQKTDVNGDGVLDLVVHMATANLAEGVLQSGYAVLTGSTVDGETFEGWDYITIIPAEVAK